VTRRHPAAGTDGIIENRFGRETRYAFDAPTSKQEQEFREELVKELLDLPLDPTLETREFAL
jgi:hypothetical protein